ncbi:hypothetical protein [Haladaptatus sp. DFWS20]|uniref:hypothetical protein n=1 Tax=Haladaptatus sp. DFWS20 TaxID=3403467 RepID=UPI003EBEDCCF
MHDQGRNRDGRVVALAAPVEREDRPDDSSSETTALDSDVLVQTLDGAPEIQSYDVLYDEKRRVLLQIETEEQASRAAARSVSMLP